MDIIVFYRVNTRITVSWYFVIIYNFALCVSLTENTTVCEPADVKTVCSVKITTSFNEKTK